MFVGNYEKPFIVQIILFNDVRFIDDKKKEKKKRNNVDKNYMSVQFFQWQIV